MTAVIRIKSSIIWGGCVSLVVSGSYPSLSFSISWGLRLWKGVCHMPVIHSCDRRWAMGLSCSGALPDMQSPFVLWCIDPFTSPPWMYSTGACSAQPSLCHGSSSNAASHVAARHRAFNKKRHFTDFRVFYGFVSSKNKHSEQLKSCMFSRWSPWTFCPNLELVVRAL